MSKNAAETSIKNAMMARFLDKEYAAAAVVASSHFHDPDDYHSDADIKAQLLTNLETYFQVEGLKIGKTAWLSLDTYQERGHFSKYKQTERIATLKRKFECDVVVHDDGWREGNQLLCDGVDFSHLWTFRLLPVLTEDFQPVLARCLRDLCNCLLIREYTGTGASFDQVHEIFANRNIEIITEELVDEFYIKPPVATPALDLIPDSPIAVEDMGAERFGIIGWSCGRRLI